MLSTTQYSSSLFKTRSQDVRDYMQDFSGGEDSFKNPNLLADNQCQKLVNVIVRDNFEARTRPGADAIPTLNTPPVASATSVFALRYYDTAAHHQLLASVAVGNTPHILSLEANAWTDLSLPSGFPASSDSRIAMAQGVDKLLMSDGSSKGYIWDGANFTSAGNGATDMPVGATILTFFQGCMYASGVASTPDGIWVSQSLAFTTTNWDGTNRQFRIGAGDGDPVIALAPMQGITMAVLKRNSVWLLTYNPTADKGGTTAISAFTATQAISYGIGCVGRDAWCAYGNDILFMAQDGVRSVQRMQAAAGQWQLTAPISQPIQPYIARINQSAWDKIVAIKYQEFAFFWVPLDSSTVNNYCLVWNGRLGTWMGAWVGGPDASGNIKAWTARCAEITRFSGATRLVFGDAYGLVNQWKDLSPNADDATYFDNTIGYPTKVWPRSMQFGDPINSKSPYNAIIRFSAGNATAILSWYNDTVTQRSWNGSFAPSGDILGIGTLPFLLSSTSPTKVVKGLRGLPPFNQGNLGIETQTGWFWLNNLTVNAYMNPLKESS